VERASLARPTLRAYQGEGVATEDKSRGRPVKIVLVLVLESGRASVRVLRPVGIAPRDREVGGAAGADDAVGSDAARAYGRSGGETAR
jgi:hypothetical protein